MATTPSASTLQPLHASILVFKGEPLDYQSYRHTALCFRTAPPAKASSSSTSIADSSSASALTTTAAAGAPLIIHAIGSPGAFELQLTHSYDPSLDATKTLLHDVPVGPVGPARPEAGGPDRHPVSRAEIAALLLQVPVQNADPEFNCQVWVERALRRLWDAGWLEERQYGEGLEGMVEVVLMGEEEPDG